jgi:hypothetical protein
MESPSALPPSAAVPPAPWAPVILIAALLQGAALYGLQRAVEGGHWPATQPGWLLALYELAVFIPTSVQLLADRARNPAMWLMLLALALAIAGFGWHHGAAVVGMEPVRSSQGTPGVEELVTLTFIVQVWCLLVLPFLQSRLEAQRWTLDYGLLFKYAWRNALMLLEAALFTGIFWLILELWQTLFAALGFEFFQRLFVKPEFYYPVTTLSFGCALYLIGSVEPLVKGALEQLLNLLKWLACVTFVLLAAFTVPLLLSIPGLVATGHHAVNASWLLWLVAVLVLLLNAAYRDGTGQLPYPSWIALGFRVLMPLTVLVAGTALYSLQARVNSEGITVERMWGLVVAGAALLYSCGYALAAVRPGPWLSWLARVNVAGALALIVTIAAYMTPLLSPYRLAADSQYARILAGQHSLNSGERYNDRFESLRHRCGAYGRARLAQLASLRNHPDAEYLRARAASVLHEPSRGAAEVQPPDAAEQLAEVTFYPPGRKLDEDLRAALVEGITTGRLYRRGPFIGVFADLDGDGTDEFVLVASYTGWVYGQQGGHWTYIGGLTGTRPWAVDTLRDAVSHGEVKVQPPPWRDLVIGTQRLRVQPEP